MKNNRNSNLVTKTYLDVELAKSARTFDKKLNGSVKAFDKKLEVQSRAFYKRLDKSGKAFDSRLEEQAIAFTKKLDESVIAFERKLQMQTKALDDSVIAFDKKLQVQGKAFDDRLMGLGGRWGKDTELALREGMKTILEKDFNAKVKHWYHKGKIVQVHPRKEEYELDLIISDGKLILIEVKGSTYPAQVERFEDNVKAYEFINKAEATRKLVITPYVDPEAKKLAEKLDIEITSPPLEYYDTKPP